MYIRARNATYYCFKRHIKISFSMKRAIARMYESYETGRVVGGEGGGEVRAEKRHARRLLDTLRILHQI